MTSVHPRALVIIPTFNEGDRFVSLMDTFPAQRAYDVLVVDDGSTDDALARADLSGVSVIRHEENRGVGASLRDGILFARRHGYDIVVIMAGNGKMSPSEIPALLQPILDSKADYVQGSRFLDGGQSANLPRGRRLAIRWLTRLTNLLLGFRGTDVTCGFRAYRLSLLDDPEIDIEQDWLDCYELEYYLHIKVIRGGYRVVEVPVSMTYPREKRNYSKIRPFVGWWSILKPWFCLSLGLKH
ncbi:MAG: glycosyltransferase family 2 protein [Candidatus Zixiibacteriota bacterium]|nr:MAG: glycosyltransferase family 2 protein [candidate division Zixibacteria bacterium]